MTDRAKQITPEEAAAALDSIGRLSEIALRRGLHSRRWAISVSLWTGAIAVATAFDGGAASGAIAALVGGGAVGFALCRRRVVARVKGVHGVSATVAAIAIAVALLAIGLLGAAAYEAYSLPWLPFASGSIVAAALFVSLEVLRRMTRAGAAAGCPGNH